jgi:hypothetical protein
MISKEMWKSTGKSGTRREKIPNVKGGNGYIRTWYDIELANVMDFRSMSVSMELQEYINW